MIFFYLTLQQMCLCMSVWYERGKKSPSSVILLYVLQSCEDSTKCPYRFVFKSWFVVWSFTIFSFKPFLLPHTPVGSPCSFSVTQLLYEAALSYLWMYSAGLQYKTCLKFADTKRCLWPVTMLFHWIREETYLRGTLVNFVKLRIWSPLSITCKKKM